MDRYNVEAREILIRAQSEAALLRGRWKRKPPTIGSGHLLLALALSDAEPLQALMHHYGIEQNMLRRLLVGSPSPKSDPRSKRFSTGCREALMCASLHSIGLATDYLGPEHLLLGLSSAEETTAGVLLAEHGATTESLKAFVRDFWFQQGFHYVPLGEQMMDASTLMSAGRFDEAAIKWEHIVKLWPLGSGVGDAQFAVCLALGSNPSGQRDGRRMLPELHEAANLPLRKAIIKTYWASVLLEPEDASTSDIEQSQVLTRAALDLAPDSEIPGAALTLLATSFLRQGRSNEALTTAREALTYLHNESCQVSDSSALVFGGANVVATMHDRLHQSRIAGAQCVHALSLIATRQIEEARLALQSARLADDSVSQISEVVRALSEAESS